MALCPVCIFHSTRGWFCDCDSIYVGQIRNPTRILCNVVWQNLKEFSVRATTAINVSVIGLGYIGLPTAAFFANAGQQVLGIDTDPRIVDSVNDGVTPFDEPGFAALLQHVVDEGLLRASATLEAADAFVIAVPTPVRKDHRLDDRYIRSAVSSIARVMQGGELVVLESTSPPGTTSEMAKYLLSLRPDLTLESGKENSVYFAYCPERVIPGGIMREMASNDRVIGGLNSASLERARNLYKTFVNGSILGTDAKTAEMAKLTENSYRDVNIAFANELSLICAENGVDVWELIELANHHPRVNILEPGPGVGGHCIAVDPWFIISSTKQARLIEMARRVNDAKPDFVVRRVEDSIASTSAKTVAILGLTFKANVEDLRESPALAIAETLTSDHPDVHFLIVEPHVEVLPGTLGSHSNADLVDLSAIEEECEIIVLLVDHDEFLEPVSDLNDKVILDFKGVWSS